MHVDVAKSVVCSFERWLSEEQSGGEGTRGRSKRYGGLICVLVLEVDFNHVTNHGGETIQQENYPQTSYN